MFIMLVMAEIAYFCLLRVGIMIDSSGKFSIMISSSISLSNQSL
ncbi:MAG: hypothetical protein WBA71_00615 [Candidatus Humimicrobiia bacterium]